MLLSQIAEIANCEGRKAPAFHLLCCTSDLGELYAIFVSVPLYKGLMKTWVVLLLSESVNTTSSAGNWFIFPTSKSYEAQPHSRGQEKPFPLVFFFNLTIEGGKEKVVVFIEELFVLF